MRLIACLFVGFALAVLPAQADNTALKRLTLRSDLSGWEAVGRLDLGEQGFCTGVLISPTRVLTAAHCLAEAERDQRVDHLSFRAGLTDGTAIAERGVARAVMHPNYHHGTMSAENLRYDVGLVELASPIPAANAAPFLVEDLPRAGAEVSVVSYGRGRAEALSRQATCSVVGRQAGLLAFDCDVTFGSSGAPLFDLTGRRARIISLVSAGGETASGRTLAFGMALPARLADLKRLFTTGDGVFPKREINARRLSVGDRGDTGARFVRPGGS